MNKLPPDLIDIYVVSNTPAYLWKRMRAHPAVQQLANEPLPVLVAELRKRLPRTGHYTPEQVSTAYALLVAMLTRGTLESREAARALPIGQLDWGWSIYELADALSAPITHARIQAPAVAHSSASSATTAHVFTMSRAGA